ncbi:MAG TPA: SHOCT domain-containing protein [Jatrophihabitans sp.]|jgi:hypothetical protein|uniref:SHOCT domain-containing protein n=1 Tax=Jatrophihabitans sp. TaxID=1932789 RepID=UPI002EDC942E
MDGLGGFSSVFPWVFGAAVVLVVCGWIYSAMTFIRNRQVLRQAGLDPMTAESQLAIRLMRSQALGEPSASSRLAELGDLRDRGLITAEEYDARRAQIIAGI